MATARDAGESGAKPESQSRKLGNDAGGVFYPALLHDLGLEIKDTDMMGLGTPIDADEELIRDHRHESLLLKMYLASRNQRLPYTGALGATPHGTLGCGQASRALLRARH